MKPVYVTKPFFPPFGEYVSYLKKIWQEGQVTNNGPMVQQLNERLKSYLGVEYIRFVSNGTVAIMLAINALGLEHCEIITTPFTYIATTTAILWQKCSPVFADINPESLCVDPAQVEQLVTRRTGAILAVHVFGIPCDVIALEKIGKKYNLPVIYDASHAFGVRYKGKSILNYGHISTLSFHATKLFHTVEGGAVATTNERLYEIYEREMRFGHDGDEHFRCGINAKNSEFHAAMGLANFKYIDGIIAARREICAYYDNALARVVQRPEIPDGTEYNYAYYPVIFENEEMLLEARSRLNAQNIFPRRYFYPSLDEISYTPKGNCPISNSVSKRILCLPLYVGISQDALDRTIETVIKLTKEKKA